MNYHDPNSGPGGMRAPGEDPRNRTKRQRATSRQASPVVPRADRSMDAVEKARTNIRMNPIVPTKRPTIDPGFTMTPHPVAGGGRAYTSPGHDSVYTNDRGDTYDERAAARTGSPFPQRFTSSAQSLLQKHDEGLKLTSLLNRANDLHKRRAIRPLNDLSGSFTYQ